MQLALRVRTRVLSPQSARPQLGEVNGERSCAGHNAGHFGLRIVLTLWHPPPSHSSSFALPNCSNSSSSLRKLGLPCALCSRTTSRGPKLLGSQEFLPALNLAHRSGQPIHRVLHRVLHRLLHRRPCPPSKAPNGCRLTPSPHSAFRPGQHRSSCREQWLHRRCPTATRPTASMAPKAACLPTTTSSDSLPRAGL